MIQHNLLTTGVENSLPDIKLIQMAKEGNLEAFTILYERYLPMVHNRVRYVIPTQDVEDVTQEVFVAMMKSLKSFKGNAKFSTWLRTLTNRRVADYYRKRKAAGQQVDIDLSDTGSHHLNELKVEANTAKIDDRVILQQALRALPQRYQEVLLLRCAEGLQFNEIAQVQGQTLEATKSLFRRAVASLRKQVGEGYYG